MWVKLCINFWKIFKSSKNHVHNKYIYSYSSHISDDEATKSQEVLDQNLGSAF